MIFPTKFLILLNSYDTVFPKREIEIKTQHLQSPWITRQIIKKRTTENDTIYQKSKTSYYQHNLKLFEIHIKRHGKMKEVIRKKLGTCDSFPEKLIIGKVEITDMKTLLKHLTTFL